MSDLVTTERAGDVAVITLDDGKANALSFDAIDGLTSALTAAQSDAKAAVLLGREGKFSAGFDLKVMTGSADGAKKLLGAGAELGLQVFASPIPVVLGVTGHALAMGGILTTCADYRVGAEGPFKIGLNEVAIGMPVPRFAVELTRDRIVKTWFTRCIQHAHICSPDEAVLAGFLDETVAAGEVKARCTALAAQLAETVHPLPFRITRQNIRGALEAKIRSELEADLALFEVSGP
jgi:enoyl-CoA hydratase